MTNKLQTVTVYDIAIVNGSPVRTPCEIHFDPANQVEPSDCIERFSHNELTQESGRLNRSFNAGYFGH